MHDGAYAQWTAGRRSTGRRATRRSSPVGTALGAPTAITFGLQVVMGLVTLLLCVDLGPLGRRRHAGAVAGLLYACEPGQWIHGAFVLSETLFTACVALALAAAARFLVTSRRRWIVVAATAAVASAYVRPIGYLLVPVVLGAVLWAGRRPAGPTARGRAAGGHAAKASRPARAARTTRGDWRAYAKAATLTAVVLLGAWHLRNGMETGYWGFSVPVPRRAA
ncbi:MAG: glycosyltransferase family 39 protein [Vicinamibacterales bacterium]